MGAVTHIPSGNPYNHRGTPRLGVARPPRAGAASGSATATNPWVRTVLSASFMLLMLAAAHLSMMVVNAIEARIDAPQPSAGIPARMFTDSPLDVEIAAALTKATTPEAKRVLGAALVDARAGRDVAFRTLPVTPTLVQAALLLTALGGLLLFFTTRLQSDAAQTILGIFAGNLIWTGGVEYGLTIAARSLGVAKAMTVVNGQLTGIYGEYVILKHTWGAMVLVGAYIAFLESSRCPISVWWRKVAPARKAPGPAGRIDNFGPRSAFQYATTVWGFYLLLLWAYDETVFGVHSWFTNGVMFSTLAGGIYCLWRLHQHRGWGPAVRYSVGAVIVAWTPLEIAGKWNLFRAPWILLQSSSFIVFFGGLALGTGLLWHASRRKPVVAERAPAA